MATENNQPPTNEAAVSRKYAIEVTQKSSAEESRKSGWGKYKDLWVPLSTLTVALITILSTLYTARMNTDFQLHMKQLDVRMKDYELNFKNKQDAYSSFMVGLAQAYETSLELSSPKTIEKRVDLLQSARKAGLSDSAIDRLMLPQSAPTKDLSSILSDIESSYYRMEPFLDEETRKETWEQLQRFGLFCKSIARGEEAVTSNMTQSEMGERSRKYTAVRTYFRDALYPSLFKQTLQDEVPENGPKSHQVKPFSDNQSYNQ